MKKILVFDNYDSFTYNLVHIIEKILDQDVDVYRNDKISLEEIDRYEKIILSPGPGIPKDAGIMIPLIQKYAGKKDMFGVCLGHQAIAQAFGGSITNLDRVYHGISTPVQVKHPEDTLLAEVPEKFLAGRYHSWIVNKGDFPAELEVTIEDEDGRIMGLTHKKYNIKGLQFHPESVLTEHGEKIIENWLNS